MALAPSGWYFLNVIDYKLDGGGYLPIRDILIYALLSCGLQFVSPSVWAKPIIKALDGHNERRRHPDYRLNQNLEYLLVFRKPGKREVDPELAEISKSMIRNDAKVNEWQQFTAVMHFNTAPGRQRATELGNAIMPEQLASFLVRGFSIVGDLVLDPFAGTGTVLRLAERHGRRAVGFEISPSICLKYFNNCLVKQSISKNKTELPEQWRTMLQAAIYCLDKARTLDAVSMCHIG